MSETVIIIPCDLNGSVVIVIIIIVIYSFISDHYHYLKYSVRFGKPLETHYYYHPD